jgi:hypothetical protein
MRGRSIAELTTMTENLKYVTDADKAEYGRFVIHHLPSFARNLPPEIWHYTNAQGLIAILTTGKIFSTQISCLNDNLERRYFGDLVLASLKDIATKSTDVKLAVLFGAALSQLANPDYSATWHFATCFSEVEDDLGQWRGYGGGECGYAIGFKTELLVKAIAAYRSDALFLPMSYDQARHQFLVQDVIANAQRYFLAGADKFPDLQRWANEFLEAFAYELDVFSCMLKHPKFAGEAERRLVIPFRKEDLSNVVFSQKRTLLARHLPADLTLDTGLLPISRIYIGPGPAQRVSQVSVGTLLEQRGYDVKVELSAVPYRLP